MFSKLMRVFDIFSYDIAIDLGTANTLIYLKGHGIVLNEPSVITIQAGNSSNKVLAVGTEAKKMIGRTSGNVIAVRPLRDGVIADFILAEQMIKYFIKKIKRHSFFKKSVVVVCVPSGSTPVERKAIQESIYNAGGKKVYLIEEPIAAALGADLPIMDPVGSMIVDIGGGTTEVAVMSLGGIAFSRSARVGGDKMDDAIIHYLKKYYNINVGESTAQSIKETLGSATYDPINPNLPTTEIRGIDLITGFPKEVIISQKEIQEALQPCLDSIISICKEALESAPAELALDIVGKGIVITGGGSLLKNIDVALSQALQVPIIIAPNPLESVAVGTGKSLENLKKFLYIFTRY